MVRTPLRLPTSAHITNNVRSRHNFSSNTISAANMPRRPPKRPKVEHVRQCQHAKLASINNAVNVRLLKIPAELRNKIYHSVLVEQEPYAIGLAMPWHTGIELHMPGLLSTCRQLREEASGIFYSNNSFACVSRITSKDIDDMQKYTMPRALKEFPSSILRLAPKVHITLLLELQDCKHKPEGNDSLKHDGEVHMVMEQGKFNLQGRFQCCEKAGHERTDCVDELGMTMIWYSEAIKCLVIGKRGQGSQNPVGREIGQPLIRVLQRDLEKLRFRDEAYAWQLNYDGQESNE